MSTGDLNANLKLPAINDISSDPSDKRRARTSWDAKINHLQSVEMRCLNFTGNPENQVNYPKNEWEPRMPLHFFGFPWDVARELLRVL
jgi:hypothetical protein